MSIQQNKNNGPTIRNKRLLDLTNEQSGREENNAKRQCTEGIFWPDSEDESFFSNAKLEDLLSGGKEELFGTQAQTCSSSNNNKMSQSAGSDDALFGNTSFPALAQEQEPAGTWAPADHDSQIDLYDEEDANEVFKKINLNDLSVAEMEDIFHGAEDFSEPLLQNTQLFLDAVAFKVPRTPEKLNKSAAKHNESMSFISKSVIEGIVQGTQYETCEELRNRSILDPVNWESQAFADFEKGNQAKENFPSKGEFYGLPDKVKKMILDHKGIKSLYGKKYKNPHIFGFSENFPLPFLPYRVARRVSESTCDQAAEESDLRVAHERRENPGSRDSYAARASLP